MRQIYTRLGDDGVTTTLCGDCVSKDSTICDICGEVDWIQAKIDRLIMLLKTYNNIEFSNQLNNIYLKLTQINVEMSNVKIDEKVKNYITKIDTDELEKYMNDMNIEVKGFQRFNKPLSVESNEIRVAIRKFERTLTKYLREQKVRKEIYQYVNRLSSYFFLLSVKLQKED